MSLNSILPSTALRLCLLWFVAIVSACGELPPVPSQPDPDATLRVAHNYILTHFDPHRSTSSYDSTWLFPVYDRLVHVDPDGNPVPGLAESWQFGPDGRHLDLHIRRNVRFHDGSPLDAAAVKANLDRARSLRGSSAAAELTSIADVEVIDGHHVRLHLTRSDAALPLILSDRAGMMIGPAAFEDRKLERAPIGAGPYRLLDFRSRHRARYERVKDYWDPTAQGVKQIELHYMADEITRLNSLRSGQVDMATLLAQQADEARLSGLNVVSRVGLEFSYIQLNRSRSELHDTRVRQALNHAVRRKALAEALTMGRNLASSQFFPPDYVAFDPDTGTDHYAYDPERARELLAEAGLAEGFEFELIVPAAPAFGPLYEALESQFRDIGVRARPLVMEGTLVGERFYVRGEGDAALVTWGGRPDPSQTIDLLFTAGSLPNPGGHSTPEVERLAAAARAETDPGRRQQLLRATTAEITREGLAIVLWQPAATFAANNRVEGLRVWSSGNKLEFRGIRMLK
ncbi:MAG: hypothetical protein JJU22_17940 [Gammaproteobacteria bacterium]|nr:hypothetical protein [Gammaproteobacteria bacterium]